MRTTLFPLFLISVLALAIAPSSALAVTSWPDWTSASTGAPGLASGTVAGVGVTYNGELDAFIINGGSPIWSPNSSFIGGTSTTSPSIVGDDLRLNGNFTGTNTITFASPVENPVFAIWSLGAPSIPASFTFSATATFEAGGPNAQFGGAPITVAGNVVSGREGNGVVQFTGTFSSISWTDTFENFYAFTVGLNGPISTPTPVPEPSALLLLSAGTLTGVAGTIGLRARRRTS